MKSPCKVNNEVHFSKEVWYKAVTYYTVDRSAHSISYNIEILTR